MQKYIYIYIILIIISSSVKRRLGAEGGVDEHVARLEVAVQHGRRRGVEEAHAL